MEEEQSSPSNNNNNTDDGEPPRLIADASAEDVFAERVTNDGDDRNKSDKDDDGLGWVLIKRRLHEYREVLLKLDRDRELHNVERMRMG